MAQTWKTGQPWRVTRSLNLLYEQIRAYAPRAVPPATSADSWGAFADAAHSKSSDHYPHYYKTLGATAVVGARDFPHAPGLGLDGGIVTEHLRKARDPRVQYIIFNRRITGVNYGWQWHPYTGGDPHLTHFHVSGVRTAAADSAAPWSLPGAAVPAATTSGEGMDFIIVSNPADPRNGGVFVATPAGPVAIAPTEWGSVSQAARDSCMKVASYTRVLQLCPATAPVTQVAVSDTQFAALTDRIVGAVQQAVGDEIPDDLDVETHVVAALQSSAGQAALILAHQAGEDS